MKYTKEVSDIPLKFKRIYKMILLYNLNCLWQWNTVIN